MNKPFLIAVSVVYLGYAFFDKSFAYIGVAPIYIGEVALLLGMVALVTCGVSSAILRSPVVWAILIFMFWSAMTSLPYLGVYKLNVLRDGVVWGYALFALILAGTLLRSNSVEKTLEWYCRWMPWFLLWAPIGTFLSLTYRNTMPTIPGTKVIILNISGGDACVHLAGAAAFLILGLHRDFGMAWKKYAIIRETVLWFLVILGLVAGGSEVRGGLLAFLCAITVVMVFRPFNRLTKIVVPILAALILLVSLDVRVPIRGGREISVQQIAENIQSIFTVSTSTSAQFSETKRWRVEWWTKILDYTVYGDYFFSGKGYGVNLAVDDGFVTRENLNRNPHNGHLTVLARSGVPGFALWLLLQGVLVYGLITRYFTAQNAGYLVLAKVNLFLLAYWTAYVVDISFDVYLESPHGGIPFWSTIGFIIAIGLFQDQLMEQRRPAALPAGAVAG